MSSNEEIIEIILSLAFLKPFLQFQDFSYKTLLRFLFENL